MVDPGFISSNSSRRDVTVSLWTPQGRGAVATINVCGSLSFLLEGVIERIPFRAANGKGLAAQPIGRIVFGRWGTEPTEDVVVCRVGDTELEIHCHGGMAAARRIMADWQSLNVPVVNWQQQSAQSAGVLAANCMEALTQATTLRTASILLDQEAAWGDFARRIVDLAHDGDWSALSNDVSAALSWQDLGRHLIEPFQVVLTGPPNVGKSALLNALIGYQRSVVFDQPGTTRDVVTAETAFDGWPVRLIDTAGLRDDATGLEAAGIELAHEQLAQCDLILQVSDASVDSKPNLQVPAPHVRTISVANKIDLLADSTSVVAGFPQVMAVSARTGVGIEPLVARIAEQLVPRTPAIGALIPFRSDQLYWLERLSVAIVEQSKADVEIVSAEIAS